jgi:dolichyl-phosphate-mannose-protein mannosyltransferase
MSAKRKSKGKSGAAAAPADHTSAGPRPALSAAECGCLALILLAALSVRAAYPERMAIEHFDEGVYASNLWFDSDHDYR